MFKRLIGHYAVCDRTLAIWLGPLVLLLMRLWVAIAFWHAGVTKIEDPQSTLFLFQSVYHVPLLSAGIAATLGTWIELVTPWFVGFGVLGRPIALFLFGYNFICVISYPALWPHGFWNGLFNTSAFADHKVWGLMLLTVIAFGPGRFSVDALIKRIGQSWRRRVRADQRAGSWRAGS